MNFINGAKWIRADFHLHTKSDVEFIYNDEENHFVKNYISKLKEQNIQVGVITNHNKFDFEQYKILRKKAKKEDIYLLPGIELNIDDGQKGIHTLITFDPDMWLRNDMDYINKFIDKTAPTEDHEFRYKNGRSKDNLINTIKLLNEFNKNYFIVLAHVNQGNGFFEELGSRRLDLKKEPTFQESVIAIQKFRGKDNDIIKDVFNKIPAKIEASDPKNIDEIGKGNKCYIKISDYNFDAIKFALFDYENKVKAEIPEQQNAYIKSVEYIGGKLNNQKIFLNASMNNIIGIRGSGKSSVLETIRYALDIELSDRISDNNYKNNLVASVLGSGGKVLIEIHNNKGDCYKLQKTLNERTIIYKEDEIISNLKPEHIIKLPLYFGQKDLSSIGDNQTIKEFILRLISKKVTEQQHTSEEISFNIKNIINSIDKINKDLNKKDDIQSKIAELEVKIENFRTFGIEDKLEKETVFNKDERRISHVKKTIRQKINLFIDFLNDNNDFSSLKEYKSTENQEILNDLKKTTEKIEDILANQFDNQLNILEDLFIEIEEIAKKFGTKKIALQEEFAKIKREIKLPSNIKADDYQKYKSNLENYNLQLKELDKKTKQKKDLKNELYQLLVKLKDSWQKEFETIRSEISNVNNQQNSIKINAIFKGDKTSYASFIQDMVRGSNIRKQRIEELVSRYNDLIDLYFDFEDNNRDFGYPEWFDDIFYDNLLDFLPYRVPDTFDIEYNGRPLIQHSLGQRASALIVFLLSLHENELIIIDQPEDDLDSQTIYNEMITTLKKLKTTTQFIFATHNPNIPVLGDCEQIFACTYDNTNEKINFISGGIDNKSVQQKIIDIMEGGEAAFEERKMKYIQWKH